MLSYHSSNVSVVSQIGRILEKESLPVRTGEAADKKNDMRDRYEFQNTHLSCRN